MNVALPIIFAFLRSQSTAVSGRGKDMDLEEWRVGGRGFGTVFVFFSSPARSTLPLRSLGRACGRQGRTLAFFILCAGTLGHVISYWLLPPVWPYAKENKLHS